MSKKRFIQGTLMLTCAGIFSRFIGFFYRIFLSHTIGAEGLGIYQLVFPIQTLIMAMTTSGIAAAISRICASRIALGKEKESRICLFSGTLIATLLSCILSYASFHYADFLAVQILKEPRTYTLIQLLSFSFPLSTIHTCINNYYYARKKTTFPAVLQFLEQLVRVSSCVLVYQILLSKNLPVTPSIAAWGTLAGEVFACLISLLYIGLEFQKFHFSCPSFTTIYQIGTEILPTALPITLNRILITLLGGIEVILIPGQLQSFGLSSGDALSVYGVFTGMALPLLLFPSAVTNSASTMLLPSIAEFQALGYKKRISYAVRQTRQYCLLLGSFCGILFLIGGRWLGTFLFHNLTAGLYIRTLSFMCPFLYLNSALASILHGLGQSGLCLLHSVAGISIRICFVVFAIPVFGIQGYLYGILLSEVLTAVFNNLALSLKFCK